MISRLILGFRSRIRWPETIHEACILLGNCGIMQFIQILPVLVHAPPSKPFQASCFPNHVDAFRQTRQRSLFPMYRLSERLLQAPCHQYPVSFDGDLDVV